MLLTLEMEYPDLLFTQDMHMSKNHTVPYIYICTIIMCQLKTKEKYNENNSGRGHRPRDVSSSEKLEMVRKQILHWKEQGP